MHRALPWLVALFLLAGLALPAKADAPPLIPVQGYLTDVAGKPIEGAQQLRFRLYDTKSPSGASTEILHEETQSLTLEKGFFTVYLGETKALDLSTFVDQPSLWLGIKVGGDAEGSPLLQVSTAPFAAFAQYCGDAQTLEGESKADLHAWTKLSGVPSNFTPAAHSHAYAELSGIPSSFTPAAHSHDYGSLTGIPSSFTPAAHSHAYGSLTGIPSSFTPAAHGHAFSELTNVPAGLADGDNDTTYQAGNGLDATGTTFSVKPSEFLAAPVLTNLGTAVHISTNYNGPGGDTIVTSSLNVPGPGKVMAFGMAAAACAECDEEVPMVGFYHTLSTSPTATGMNSGWNAVTLEKRYSQVSQMQLFTVAAAGTFQVYWRAGISPTTRRVQIERAKVQLLFIPD